MWALSLVLVLAAAPSAVAPPYMGVGGSKAARPVSFLTPAPTVWAWPLTPA